MNEKNKKISKMIISIIVILGVCGVSFLLTAGIYWLFTIIMFYFFSVAIPFTWFYALGVWLIIFLIRLVFSRYPST